MSKKEPVNAGFSFYNDGQQFYTSFGEDGFSVGGGDVPATPAPKRETERIPAAYIAAGGAAALLLLLLVLAKK